jgi:16S rRNA (cytosine967-C5)-methyltransferase
LSRYYSYLNSSIQILDAYKGQEPFSIFLKKYFSANKKFGSSDRKVISNLCYCYFRTGHAFKDPSTENKLVFSLFLCSANHDPLLEVINPGLNEKVQLPIQDKIKILQNDFNLEDIFPWVSYLCNEIEIESFILSHLVQPSLFIRARPGNSEKVGRKLTASEIPFQKHGNDCFQLSNSTKLEELFDINKEVVIQDLNSQRIGEMLTKIDRGADTDLKVWDCCAASGGKSILAIDILKKVDLTVSDIRPSILSNLIKRFAEAGIKNYKSFIADLTKQVKEVPDQFADLVIADVPCSGSGTWSRTPEQLFYFNEEKIVEFSSLQQSIISHVIPHLKTGGYLLYITCSVFKQENEDNAQWISENFPLELIEQQFFKGYEKQADSLYAALLKKV